jgi:hypothetical protein
MCFEASTVLRAVAADFFFNCWYLEISSDNRIRHITKVRPLSCAKLTIGNVLQFLYVGSGSRTPELYVYMWRGVCVCVCARARACVGGHVHGYE